LIHDCMANLLVSCLLWSEAAVAAVSVARAYSLLVLSETEGVGAVLCADGSLLDPSTASEADLAKPSRLFSYAYAVGSHSECA
jgi:hypothetical protein